MITGLESFIQKDYKRFKKLRLGVLCNQASILKDLTHASQAVTRKTLGLNIACFIGPQHGIRGEKQDNMIESDDFIDPTTQKPVFSLYGKMRQPTDDLLSRIDAFLIDLQDIGTRIYTFMYTMAYCMQAAKRSGKKVIILDRPNPIGGIQIEGNSLEQGFTSFVGLYPMVTRHGLTMGELALFFNEQFGIGCDLEIIKLKGWKRVDTAINWKRDWVPPSPNIPNLESAIIFPGMVHFEGTNLSEGRGTTKPFESIGAPFIQADALATQMNKKRIPGAHFRAIYFQPTYQKWAGHVCGGVQLHITKPKLLNSFRAGIELLCTIAQMYPSDFAWKQPPYEYETDRMPIDLITGTAQLREVVEGKSLLGTFLERAKKDTEAFAKLRKPYLLY